MQIRAGAPRASSDRVAAVRPGDVIDGKYQVEALLGEHAADVFLRAVGADPGRTRSVPHLTAPDAPARGDAPRLLALLPGSGGHHKRIPREIHEALAARWSAASGEVVVVLGPAEPGEDEAWRAIGAVARPDSVGRLAAVLAGATAFVGNDAGLRYSVREVDREMPAYGYAQPMKPELRRLTETLGYWPVNRDQPIVGIRVTRFRNGTVIGITHTHVLMDGVSSWIFLERWSQHFRGQLDAVALPFDRTPLRFADSADHTIVDDDQIRAQPASQLQE